MYAYHLTDYAARDRIQQRMREAETEQIIRRTRARKQRRRRRRYLAAALDLLIAARRQARADA
jgi:hypothetical protein